MYVYVYINYLNPVITTFTAKIPNFTSSTDYITSLVPSNYFKHYLLLSHNNSIQAVDENPPLYNCNNKL